MSAAAPPEPSSAALNARHSCEGGNPASFARYPKYKNSGVAWLGEVPAHWDLCSLRRRVAMNPSKSEIATLDRDLEISFLPMEAVGEQGQLDLDRKRPIREVENGYTYFHDGDVTFAKITPCFENGKGALMRGLTNGAGFGTTELTVIRSKPELLYPEFLDWLLRTVEFRGQGEASMYGAGGQKRVPDDFVRDFRAAFPPAHEQVVIAAFLDRETTKIDALIAEQEKLITLLKEKRQALISHAVTKGLDLNAPMKDSGIEWLGQVPAHWEIAQIKRLSVVKRGASPRPIDDPKYFDDEGKYAWVRISDVSSSNGVLAETTQRLSDLGSSFSVKLAPGSLFVSIAGTVGKPCITGIDACIHDGFVYFPTLKLDPKFLYRIFEAGRCYAGLGKFGTQLNLNTDTIGSISIAVPPKDEMREVLSQLDSLTGTLDCLVGQAECASGLLRERRAALISAAVTGKFDVRQMVGDVAA